MTIVKTQPANDYVFLVAGQTVVKTPPSPFREGGGYDDDHASTDSTQEKIKMLSDHKQAVVEAIRDEPSAVELSRWWIDLNNWSWPERLPMLLTWKRIGRHARKELITHAMDLIERRVPLTTLERRWLSHNANADAGLASKSATGSKMDVSRPIDVFPDSLDTEMRLGVRSEIRSPQSKLSMMLPSAVHQAVRESAKSEGQTIREYVMLSLIQNFDEEKKNELLSFVEKN